MAAGLEDTGDFTLSIVPSGVTLPPTTDGCFQSLGALTVPVTRNGAWNGDCASTHRPGRYARFYSFTLNQQAEVEINLTSAQDTYLYLLRGADANGTVVADNDDVETGNTDSRITETLVAGTYTIEATTYNEGVTGEFTLSIIPSEATTPPPADAYEYVLTAASPGAPPGGGVPGQWTSNCASTNQHGSYARFYSFTLDTGSEVTITLESSVDTFLYLLEGAGTGGTVVARNDDIETGNTNWQVREFLSAGTYTIEATTYKEGVTGEFTLTVTVVTVTVVPTSADREALVALYHATDGPNWRNTHNWLGNAPLGQWYGVTTDAGDRVTGLQLSFNGLTGQATAQLGNLSGLTRLDLWFNQLSGQIPPELGNLSSLEDLNLWHNRLSGRIPGTLGNLSNLTYLGLGSNRLSGSIPPELGRLGNLTGLSLSDNRLTGEIPAELSDLSNLTSLYLSANQLTGCIPEGVQGVANNDFASLGLPFCASGDVSRDRAALVALYNSTNGRSWTNNHNWLSNSALGQWYGVTTDSSGRVTGLHLHENELSGRIPLEVGDLSNLNYLNLWGNQLSGGIPTELGRLTNLMHLYLRNNQLRGEIPAELGNLSLRYLALAGNQLSGCIPQGLREVLENDLDALGLPFCGAGSPDLIVQPFSVSDLKPDVGGPIVLYATVQNVGDVRLESARLTYYLSDNDTISGRDAALRTVYVFGIDASGSTQRVLYGQHAPQAGTASGCF